MPNPYATAIELLELLRTGEASALELTDMYLNRIEALNPAINAVVWQDAEGARSAARQVAGPPTDEQPLLGLPITVKEAYGLVGSPTTWGNPDYRDNISTEDALAVQRLKAAGAIIIGKTNVPLNLADFQSYNDIYGQCNNPYNLERTPGGSSGGLRGGAGGGHDGLGNGLRHRRLHPHPRPFQRPVWPQAHLGRWCRAAAMPCPAWWPSRTSP